MKIIIKKKVTVIILGFLLCVALLEIGLRIGGFVYTTLQERRNITSLKQKGTYRIMCLGDNTTNPAGVFKLEEILNKHDIGIKFSVINKAVPGVDTSYIVEHLEENLSKYTPDIVITMMGINDIDATTGYKDIPIETYKLVKLLRKSIEDKISEVKIYKREGMLKKAIKQNPKNAIAYIDLGRCYRDQGKYDKAEEIYKKDIEQNPRHDLAYVELGRCYLEQEKYGKAEAMFEKSIELNHGNDMAYFELNRCYLQQEKFDKGEEILKKAIELNPTNSIFHVGLGRAYRTRGNYFASEAMFDKIIELNPGNDMAYYELGCSYKEHGIYGRAEKMFKKAIEQNPRNNRAQFELGHIYREQGRYGKVEEIFRKVIESDPGDDRIYFELERCYLEQEKYDKAEEILKKAIEQNPKNDIAYSELALLYETMGKNKLAQEYHQKAEAIRLQRANLITRPNYQELKRKLDKRGIKLVCVQYPMRSVELLKKTLEPYKDVVFVDNEKLFKDAIKQGNYDEYFLDTRYIDFGHCTPKGFEMLAANIADVILKEWFSKYK